MIWLTLVTFLTLVILLVTLVMLLITGIGKLGSVLIIVVSVISKPSEKNSDSAIDMFLPGILFSNFVSTIAAVAGISLVGQAHLPSVGFVADLEWSSYYDSWEHASQNKAAAFVLGGGALLKSLGIPESFANTLMAVLVISFAATTLDTATRIQRFILNEFGKASKIHFLSNRFLATIVAVVPAMMMALAGMRDKPSIIVPGGSTLAPENGEDAGKIQSIGARFSQGEITLDYAQDMGCKACASPGGGCQFLGTAGTSQVIAESLGCLLYTSPSPRDRG